MTRRTRWPGLLFVTMTAFVAGACPPPGPPPGHVVYAMVSAGGGHTCAVDTGGIGYCWGENASGQLGTGNTTPSPKPVRVSGNLRFTKISAGTSHTCGLAQGTVYCWGLNLNGQVGNGAAPDGGPVLVPTAISRPGGVPPMLDVAAGGDFSCAVGNNHVVFCWGQTFMGKLGLGPSSASGVGGPPANPGESVTSPQPILLPTTVDFERVAAGVANACARALNGDLWCWGSDLFKQLSDPPTEACDASTYSPPCRHTPLEIATNASGMAVGPDYLCFTDPNYDVTCRGASADGQIAATASPLPNCSFVNGMVFACAAQPVMLTRPMNNGNKLGFIELTAGDGWMCSAFYPVGQSVRCWGRNDHGQVGNGQSAPLNQPVPPTAFATPLGALSLSAGGMHTCLVTDGANAHRIYCWGKNGSGQLGIGQAGADQLTPTLIAEP